MTNNGAITIYDNASVGVCVDSVMWIIKERVSEVPRSLNESTEHEFIFSLTDLSNKLYCFSEAIETLKMEGWRITKHYIAGDKVFVFIEL